MVHIVIILVILMSWCFYFQFNRALETRKKLIYVEVRSKDQIVSRIQSKENLNIVNEYNKRKRNNNQLFDKFWYQTRETIANAQAYEGFYVDSQGLVAAPSLQSQYLSGSRAENLKRR